MPFFGDSKPPAIYKFLPDELVGNLGCKLQDLRCKSGLARSIFPENGKKMMGNLWLIYG